MHLPLKIASDNFCPIEDERKAYLVHRPDRLTDILTEYSTVWSKTRTIRLSKRRQESNIVLIELMKDGLPGGLKALPPIIWFSMSIKNIKEKIRSILWGQRMSQFFMYVLSLQGSNLLYGLYGRFEKRIATHNAGKGANIQGWEIILLPALLRNLLLLKQEAMKAEAVFKKFSRPKRKHFYRRLAQLSTVLSLFI